MLAGLGTLLPCAAAWPASQRVGAPAAIPDSAVRATAEAIFRNSAYRPADTRTRIWQWLLGEIGELLNALLPAWRAVRANPVLYWSLIVLLGLLAAALLARGVEAALRRGGSASPVLPSSRRTAGRDPWLLAQEEAARGDFTAAAHALYLALLEAAARQGQIRPHPCKTAGDYLRELRAGGSTLRERFRDFARAYEVIIYGLGWCDREHFERLRAIALTVVRPRV